jgi:hypothetical protein
MLIERMCLMNVAIYQLGYNQWRQNSNLNIKISILTLYKIIKRLIKKFI